MNENMRIIPGNKAVLSLISNLKKGKIKEADNHTNRFSYCGKEYCYMSETEPHYHLKGIFPRIWTIIFYAVDPDYVFIYRYKGKLHVIEPVLGQEYSFDSTLYHAFIHKEKSHTLYHKLFWKDFDSEKVLRCVFRFTDE